MKAILFLSAVLAVALADDKYTTKYDNIDLDEILHSDRLLDNYFNCLMDEGRCTPDGAELKKAIPEALKNDCSKCNEKQRAGAQKVIAYLIEKKPDMWKKLEEKYDSDGTYRKKYESEAQKHNIKV